jgi:hypothetical protein
VEEEAAELKLVEEVSEYERGMSAIKREMSQSERVIFEYKQLLRERREKWRDARRRLSAHRIRHGRSQNVLALAIDDLSSNDEHGSDPEEPGGLERV